MGDLRLESRPLYMVGLTTCGRDDESISPSGDNIPSDSSDSDHVRSGTREGEGAYDGEDDEK